MKVGDMSRVSYFLKLNLVSLLYGLLFVLPFEFMMNLYRINRLTRWDFETLDKMTYLILLVEAVGGTLLLIYLTKKWLSSRGSSYWTIVLWLPYALLFFFAFAFFLPISNHGDEPNPAIGLLVIGGAIGYPVYVLVVNALASPLMAKATHKIM